MQRGEGGGAECSLEGSGSSTGAGAKGGSWGGEGLVSACLCCVHAAMVAALMPQSGWS